MKKHLQRLTIAGTLITIMWGMNSFAHSEHFTKSTRSAEQSYEFRDATMSIYKWYLSPMGAMVKGKIAFNNKNFSLYADNLEALSNIDLLEGFPKGSSQQEVDDSNAKEAIWSNWKDFEKKYKTFQSEAKQLAAVAKSGDKAKIIAQFKKTADTCTSCHKQYKEK